MSTKCKHWKEKSSCIRTDPIRPLVYCGKEPCDSVFGENRDIFTKEEIVWLYAWSEVAACDSCSSDDIATKFADSCLEDFKERFENNG